MYPVGLSSNGAGRCLLEMQVLIDNSQMTSHQALDFVTRSNLRTPFQVPKVTVKLYSFPPERNRVGLIPPV